MSQSSKMSKILFKHSCGYFFVDILYSAKVYGSAKIKGQVRPFFEPVAAFFNFDGSAALQAVSKCTLIHLASIWKYFQYESFSFNNQDITMRSKPDYVEFVLLQLLLMLFLRFLLFELFIRGQLWWIKVYLILIEAITVVELASRPCLDLAFTLPNPFLDLAMNLP